MIPKKFFLAGRYVTKTGKLGGGGGIPFTDMDTNWPFVRLL